MSGAAGERKPSVKVLKLQIDKLTSDNAEIARQFNIVVEASQKYIEKYRDSDALCVKLEAEIRGLRGKLQDFERSKSLEQAKRDSVVYSELQAKAASVDRLTVEKRVLIAQANAREKELLSEIASLNDRLGKLTDTIAAYDMDSARSSAKVEAAVAEQRKESEQSIAELQRQLLSQQTLGEAEARKTAVQAGEIERLKGLLGAAEKQILALEGSLAMETLRADALVPKFLEAEAEQAAARDVLVVSAQQLAYTRAKTQVKEEIDGLKRELKEAQERARVYITRRVKLKRIDDGHKKILTSMESNTRVLKKRLYGVLGQKDSLVSKLFDQIESLKGLLNFKDSIIQGYLQQFLWMGAQVHLLIGQLNVWKSAADSAGEREDVLAGMVENLQAGRERLYQFFRDIEAQEKARVALASASSEPSVHEPAGVAESKEAELSSLGTKVDVATLFAPGVGAGVGAGSVLPESPAPSGD